MDTRKPNGIGKKYEKYAKIKNMRVKIIIFMTE